MQLGFYQFIKRFCFFLQIRNGGKQQTVLAYNIHTNKPRILSTAQFKTSHFDRKIKCETPMLWLAVVRAAPSEHFRCVGRIIEGALHATPNAPTHLVKIKCLVHNIRK